MFRPLYPIIVLKQNIFKLTKIRHININSVIYLFEDLKNKSNFGVAECIFTVLNSESMNVSNRKMHFEYFTSEYDCFEVIYMNNSGDFILNEEQYKTFFYEFRDNSGQPIYDIKIDKLIQNRQRQMEIIVLILQKIREGLLFCSYNRPF